MNECINLLSLNVCGLVSKFKYDVFLEKLKEYKIVCLSETKADSIDCKTIENVASDNGFEAFCKIRKRAVKKSGGLCTLVANDIVKHVKVMNSNLEIVQWLCLDKMLFGTEKDVLLGNVYMPPHNSPYAYQDMFADLEMSLLEMNYANYHVILVGDFNAHTSDCVDYINLQEDVLDELGVRNCPDIMEMYNCKVKRCNQDKTKCDSHGSKLLQFCKTTGICIFNGRLQGDETGSCTTDKNTTIDYVIGTPSLLPHISTMLIEDFDFIFSDVHKKVTVNFNSMISRQAMCQATEGSKIKRWNNAKENDFVINMNVLTLQSISDLINQEDSSVNEINNKLTKVLLESAENTLGRTEGMQNKKLYDRECQKKKREYNRAVNKLKYNKSIENIRLKRKACREYQTAIKKFNNHKNKIFLNKLREAKTNNSKVYWSMLNKRKHEPVEPGINDLGEHFKQLNQMTEVLDQVQDRASSSRREEEEEEEETIYNDSVLNDPITEDEVLKASKKLKNNKSPGDDGIINEYIKASMPLMIKHYVGLINKV